MRRNIFNIVLHNKHGKLTDLEKEKTERGG